MPEEVRFVEKELYRKMAAREPPLEHVAVKYNQVN
jgi:hypothetical protein